MRLNMTRGSVDENGSGELEEILPPLMANSPSPPPSPAVEVEVAKGPAKTVGEDKGPDILTPPQSLSLIKKIEDGKPKPKSPLDGLRFLLNQCKLGSIKLESTVINSVSTAPAAPISNGEENKHGESLTVPERMPESDLDDKLEDKHTNGKLLPTPKIVRKRKSRSSFNETENADAIDVEPLAAGRRVTRRSSSRLSSSGDKASQSPSGSRRASLATPTLSPSPQSIPIKIKDCLVKVYRCDYKLRVYSQFNYSHKPSPADERNLIKTLQKLKGVIQTRLEARAKLDQSKVKPKPGSLRSFMAKHQTVSASITPAPRLPKKKLKKKPPQFKKCRDCPKRFSSQFQLQRHVLKWHYGRKRPFPCELCEKAFYQRGHLYDHLRMHMGETPYKCGVCQTAFHQNGQLVIHMRSHNTSSVGAGTEMEIETELGGGGGVKKVTTSYACTKCNKTFSNYLQRKRHFKNHHLAKRLLYRCSLCGKCCSSIRLLKLHYRTGHWPDEIKMMRG